MSMTVEEAIGNLIKHRIGSAREVERLKKRNDDYSWFQETVDSLDIALQSIEEIQQYRAIGTVSEFREIKNFLEFLYNTIQPNEMEQYLAMYNASEEKGE